MTTHQRDKQPHLLEVRSSAPGVSSRTRYRPSATAGRHDSPETRYPLDPVLDFMRLLWSIEHGLQKMSKRMESTLGITGPQRLVLRVVGRFPGLSAGAVAQIVRLHPSTITGILQRLVSRGLLQRERDPSDSRRTQLRLNPRAITYARTSAGTVEKAVSAALDKAGATHVRTARRVLAELAQRLNPTDHPPAKGRARLELTRSVPAW
jgi:MarR family transcriptional regulator, organic hydroperoxide resistance regulator